jgi:hypothetical protein
MDSIRRHFPSLQWLVVTIMFLIGPVAVGRMGAYMRYVGDDYCYSSALKSGGYFLGQINAFQMVQRFNGDRYSLTLLSFTTELFGPKGNALAVAVMLVLWLGGLSMAVYQLLKFLGFERAGEPSLAVASIVTFFLLLTYPDLFSVMYWVSAMYSYFAPMVTIIWLSAAIVSLLRAGRAKTWVLLALFVATWLFAAFTEVGVVVQITWLLLMTLTIWRINGNRSWAWDRKVLLLPLLATMLALATMLLSPYAKDFISSSGSIINKGDLVWEILRESLVYNLSPGSEFRTPFIVEMLILGALGFLLTRRLTTSVKLSYPAFILFLLAIFVAAWLLVAVAFLPSYLVLKSYPSPRALMPAHIIRQLEYAVVSLVSGWFIGNLVNSRSRYFSSAAILASLGLLIASLYPFRGYPYLVESEPFMRKWSVLWDQRDEQIRKAVERGESSVKVMVLDHPIPHLAELGADPNSAYNQCAQEYYGIPAIIADLPGWDDFEIP